jgi:hypothetical protein
MSHAKREVGAACALLLLQRRSRDDRLVGRTVARVPAEEPMANYQAARALLNKGNSAVTRVNERPGFPRVRQPGSSAKKSAVKKAKPK